MFATLHGTGAGVGNDFTMDGTYVGKWLGAQAALVTRTDKT